MVPPPALSALSAVSMGSALPIHMGLILASDAMQTVTFIMKKLFKILTAPLWFFDAVDKEAFVLSIPLPIRRFNGKVGVCFGAPPSPLNLLITRRVVL